MLHGICRYAIAILSSEGIVVHGPRFVLLVQNLLGQYTFSGTRRCTRASAQKVMNTPSQHHFFVIKYFKVNDNDIRQNIVINVSLLGH